MKRAKSAGKKSKTKSAKNVRAKSRDATALEQELYEQACDARDHSYSPYSGHKVGAALITSEGKVYTGCNVENSSYGATICAERTAILKAASECEGKLHIEEIVVVTDATPAWPPCGMCRQMIAEFASPETRIHAANLKGDGETTLFGELLPQAFTAEHLGK
jgi:cytidine deaminase